MAAWGSFVASPTDKQNLPAYTSNQRKRGAIRPRLFWTCTGDGQAAARRHTPPAGLALSTHLRVGQGGGKVAAPKEATEATPGLRILLLANQGGRDEVPPGLHQPAAPAAGMDTNGGLFVRHCIAPACPLLRTACAAMQVRKHRARPEGPACCCSATHCPGPPPTDQSPACAGRNGCAGGPGQAARPASQPGWPSLGSAASRSFVSCKDRRAGGNLGALGATPKQTVCYYYSPLPGARARQSSMQSSILGGHWITRCRPRCSLCVFLAPTPPVPGPPPAAAPR